MKTKLSLHPYDRREQQGQVLVLGLIVSSVALLGWVLSYSLGQLVHDKLSLLRAADAAVLSAALTQARALNTHAYLNRAQLAHQVAMAHLVSLASQERLRATQARQGTVQNPPAFLIGMFFGPTYAAAYLSARAGGLDDSVALRSLEQAFRRHDDVINEIIDRARRQLLRDLPDRRTYFFENVLIKNVGASGSAMRGSSLKQLGLSYDVKQDGMPGKVRYLSHRSEVWQSALANVFEPYGFLQPRNQTIRNAWAINIRCPHKRHALRRLGQTHLSIDGTYESNDSLSYHAIRSNKIIGCYEREYPMGWARVGAKGRGASVDDIPATSPSNFSQQPFWSWVRNQRIPGWDIFNGKDNFLAKQWAQLSPVRWTMKRVSGYADLTAQPDQPITLEVQVRQSAKQLGILGSKSSVRATGRFDVSILRAEDSIRAQSAAMTYFERPSPRADKRTEQPSLFHPFWNARLIPSHDTH